MPSYIAVQNTYDDFQIALFINDTLIGKKREDKHHTSKLFIPVLDQLLKEHNVTISDLDFCAVNCGPGPFSTLRSILASVNGIHAASNLPLIGIDGLEATFLEFYDKHYQNTVVLLNAFNNEVYYLIAHENKIVSKGYQKIDSFLKDVLTKFSKCARPAVCSEALCEGCKFVEEYLGALEEILQQVPSFAKATEDRQDERGTKDIKQTNLQNPIHLLGNGVTLHQTLIKQVLGNNAIIKDLNPSMCSIEMTGKLGLEKWQHNQSGLSAEALAKEGYLMPLHLKKHAVEL